MDRSAKNGHMALTDEPRFERGQEFHYWLGIAARRRREQAGVSMSQIAVLLDMNTTKGVERFERAENRATNPEWVLAAYGLALGIDPRDIVLEAAKDWKKHGSPPELPPPDERAGVRAVARVAAAARRAGSDQAAKRKAPPAARRHRAD